MAMTLRQEDRGAAERLLDVVLGSGAHLWHNRPGIDDGGVWRPATRARREAGGQPVAPGPFVPAAVDLYRSLLDIYKLDPELMAHFASYALVETDWRDLKIACAALMLVQPKSGQPVRDEDGSVAFTDDDYREIGEAMILRYEKGSKRMMSPKAVLRVGELLEVPGIADLNRQAGFADPAAGKPPLGRWPKAAREWLAYREANLPLLEGSVKAGYKETIKKLSRRVGYRPASERFFEVLGWSQKQAAGGHRRIGLEGLRLQKQERFDGLDEAAICDRISKERLTFKEVMGRMPAGMTLTPAIMVALMPSLSDADLRILTPTLEGLGLLADPEVRARWERALESATDQRALNIAKRVHGREVRARLEDAADLAARRAVADAIADEDLEVMFLVDTSGSMQGAIAASIEALTRILAGFAPDRLHIAAFDTVGKVLRPKAPTRAGVQHMLKDVFAGGGTTYGAALQAFDRERVVVPADRKLILIAVGDEAGEQGRAFADSMTRYGYVPAAISLIVSVSPEFTRGTTVRDAAAILQVPYSEVSVDTFSDPYQVTRVLKTMLEAPPLAGRSPWLERVLATPLLTKPT
jgi:hypothetical protein